MINGAFMRKRTGSISKSEAVLSELMSPVHANHYGSVHGGTILRLVDEAAFVVAARHARKNVVVAAMEHIDFKQPVRLGDLLIARAYLCRAGRTSMEVRVEILTERLKEGRVISVGSANITMVAVDDKGSPSPVPKFKNRG